MQIIDKLNVVDSNFNKWVMFLKQSALSSNVDSIEYTHFMIMYGTYSNRLNLINFTISLIVLKYHTNEGFLIKIFISLSIWKW